VTRNTVEEAIRAMESARTILTEPWEDRRFQRESAVGRIDYALTKLRAAAEPEAKACPECGGTGKCECEESAMCAACRAEGLEAELAALRATRCKRCGKPLAYDGAIYCGAGCAARAEAGE
jgi:hypothetical protein